jgi:hypothetical protein
MGQSRGKAVALTVLGTGMLLVALATAAGAEDDYPARLPTTTTTTTAPSTTTTTVEVKGAHAEAPPTQSDRSAGVSQFVQNIPTVHDISFKAAAPNLGFAFLFMILTAFPAIVFNSTFQEHHETITHWLNPIRTRISRFQAALGSVPSGVLLGGFSLIGALVYAQLEPGFGFDRASLVLWAALALSIFVMTSVLEYARGWRLHRRTGVRCRLETLPLSLVVAGLLVLISRVAGLHPGYIFGIVAGIAVARHISDEDDGASLAVGYALLLGLAAAAWLLWIPVRDSITGTPSTDVVFLDTLLSTFWVISLQTVLFSLIPMRFLYGRKVFAWNRWVWLALEAVAAFGFFMLLQNPSNTGAGQHNVSTALVAFLTFLGLSLLFWAWFRFVQPRRTTIRDAAGREILT